MKKAICFIVMLMILSATALPALAQYRKPPSEMDDEELDAVLLELRGKAEQYTRRTRAALSSAIGQTIGLERDGLALLKRYYPNLLAATQERANRATADPMFMGKSNNVEPGLGDQLVSSGVIMLVAIVGFADEQVETYIEQDVRGLRGSDGQELPEGEIQARTEEIANAIRQDQAEALSAEGNLNAGLIGLVFRIDEILKEKRRRIMARRPGPRPGPARGESGGCSAPSDARLGVRGARVRTWGGNGDAERAAGAIPNTFCK